MPQRTTCITRLDPFRSVTSLTHTPAKFYDHCVQQHCQTSHASRGEVKTWAAIYSLLWMTLCTSPVTTPCTNRANAMFFKRSTCLQNSCVSVAFHGDWHMDESSGWLGVSPSIHNSWLPELCINKNNTGLFQTHPAANVMYRLGAILCKSSMLAVMVHGTDKGFIHRVSAAVLTEMSLFLLSMSCLLNSSAAIYNI